MDSPKLYSSINRQQHRRQIREEMLEAYGAQCVYCGIKDIDVLDLDHIKPVLRSAKEYKKETGINFHAKLRKLDWPSGYQLLCKNCNYKKELARKRHLVAEKNMELSNG
jgi:5-methylcytosine-specific restriction endonuclease McrA